MVRPIPTIQPFEELAGPVHHLPEDATPLDFFSLLWEPSFFQLLAEQTNLYARQRQVEKPNRKWYPTTSEEIKAFLGINIIMGIDQKPALTHYWSTDPYLGNQGIQSVMPREHHLSNTILIWFTRHLFTRFISHSIPTWYIHHRQANKQPW